MEISKNIKWSPTLEEYFVDIGEKSYAYGWIHKKAEAIFAFQKTWISLPVIILSTIAGTLSIGGGSIFPTEMETLASVLIGCVSLFVGVLNTVESYFSWGKRAENHRLCSIQYFKLFRFISIELSLPVEERMLCSDLLKMTRENYERLQEIAPLIPDSVITEFKKKFSGEKYKDIAKPAETNGLEAITIYKKDDTREKALQEKAMRKFLQYKNSPSKPTLKIKVPSPKPKIINEVIEEIESASVESESGDEKISVERKPQTSNIEIV